jgi:hypothetical protein
LLLLMLQYMMTNNTQSYSGSENDLSITFGYMLMTCLCGGYACMLLMVLISAYNVTFQRATHRHLMFIQGINLITVSIITIIACAVLEYVYGGINAHGVYHMLKDFSNISNGTNIDLSVQLVIFLVILYL